MGYFRFAVPGTAAFAVIRDMCKDLRASRGVSTGHKGLHAEPGATRLNLEEVMGQITSRVESDHADKRANLTPYTEYDYILEVVDGVELRFLVRSHSSGSADKWSTRSMLRIVRVERGAFLFWPG